MLSRRAVLVPAGVGYLAILAWSYSHIIVPAWAYTGLVDRPVEDGSLLFGYVLAAVPLLFLPMRLERPSHGVVWMLYLFLYVPSSVVPYYVMSHGFALAPVSAALFAGFAIVLAMERLPRQRFSAPLVEPATYLRVLAVLALAAIAYQASTLGLNFDLPAIDDVYDVRADYADRLEDVSRLVAYAVGWTTAAIGPALIAIGLFRRSVGYGALGVLIQVLGYGLTGSKVAILSSVLLIALMLAYRESRRHQGALILVGGLALLVTAIGLTELLVDGGLLSSLFIRRLVVIPGWAFAVYSDFFAVNPTFQLSHSVLGWAIERPYELSPAHLISYTYQGRIYEANAGVWADGMANFGAAGVVGFSVALGLLLWTLDSFASNRPLVLTGPILGVACFSLVNSALLTSIATHGIAFAILLVWLMPDQRQEIRRTLAEASDATRQTGLPLPKAALTAATEARFRLP